MLICRSYDIFASYATKHFEIGFIVSLSQPHCYLELEVTGNRLNRDGGRGGYGLEIPARSRFYRPEKAKYWLETRLTKTEEQLKESVNYFLKLNIFLLVEEWFCDTQH